MKLFSIFILLMLVIACGKEERTHYPVSYTPDHQEQSDEGLYLVQSATTISNLPITTGTFGSYKQELKQEILEGMLLAFDLREIELLNEDSLRMKYLVDEEEYDTTLTYTLVDGSIMIDGLEGTLLTYEKQEDQFIICSNTVLPLAGPNVANPGSTYFQFNVTECTPGFTNKDYALRLLSSFPYKPLDTLGVVITRFIFK